MARRGPQGRGATPATGHRHAPGLGARVQEALPGVHLDRGRRQGPQPAVLRHRRELRPAVEPAAHRTTHRPLPPVRAAERGDGDQLHRQGERGAAPDVRDPERQAGALRDGPRRVRPGPSPKRRHQRRRARRGAGRRLRGRAAPHLRPGADAGRGDRGTAHAARPGNRGAQAVRGHARADGGPDRGALRRGRSASLPQPQGGAADGARRAGPRSARRRRGLLGGQPHSLPPGGARFGGTAPRGRFTRTPRRAARRRHRGRRSVEGARLPAPGPLAGRRRGGRRARIRAVPARHRQAVQRRAGRAAPARRAARAPPGHEGFVRRVREGRAIGPGRRPR